MLYDTFHFVKQFAALYPDKIALLSKEELNAFIEREKRINEASAPHSTPFAPGEDERLAG